VLKSLILPHTNQPVIMKRILLSLLIVAGISLTTFAQGIEITPFGGYVFPTRWNAYNGSLYFNGAAQYGGYVSVGVNPVMDVSFMYNRIDTKAEPEIYGIRTSGVSLSENYYMIGFTQNFRVKPNISPFASLNLGGVYYAPKESGYYSYWFFAMGLDAGAKIYFNDVIGLRLQAQLMMPVQSGGLSFYYGSGGGGSSVNLQSTMVNFGFTGGLIFRINKN
jgi:hypothetical protein